MTKMFKENGFLTEEGKKVLQPLHDALMEVMSSVEVRNMSVQELQVLQANLAKAVGDTTSAAIQSKNTVFHDDPKCNGFVWRDEYGNEAFTHSEYSYCPVCDNKK